MTVTEIKQSMGSWELRLREHTPRAVLDALTFFGHIAVLPGRLNPVEYGDNLLAKARYVGVYRNRDSKDEYLLKGSGMAFWLGDESDKGDVFETPVTLTGASFAASVTALLPPGGAVIAGTINSVAGTYTNTHQWVTPRKALDYVTETFGAEWRVNGNATLDAGTVAQLYTTTPKTILMQKQEGRDLQRIALAGRMGMGTDVEGYTSRVVLIAQGQGTTVATGAANASVVPYKDIRGGVVKQTRLVSESDTTAGNAAARAVIALNQYSASRNTVDLTTDAFDVKGDLVVGDYVDVYDPKNGYVDTAREVYWEGQPINPVALRCIELTWPISPGWTVAFRDINGVWIDLSQYYAGEAGQTTIKVGDFSGSLAGIGREDLGMRPNLPSTPSADTTIPASPTFGTFSTGNYQGSNEWTKSAILATWTQPLNTDASTIIDGDHYELRYRVNAYKGYQVRWGQVSGYRWGGLAGNRWGAPISDPVQSSGEWHTIFVGWGYTQQLVQELTPGVEYEFQIRAVDAAVPNHQGAYSASKFVIASGDLFAPSTPAVPTVASSRIALQITHTLGKATGGTFNLEADLAYLSVHIGGASTFHANDSNVIGKLIANVGMLTAQIPAVETFQIEQTDGVWVKVIAIDKAGNKSDASAGVQATVTLIDTTHISDLTVSKVTAGTITATWINAGRIATANTGARVEMANTGLQAYNAAGVNTVDIKSSDGSATFTGTVNTNVDGSGISLIPGASSKILFALKDSTGAIGDHIGAISALTWSGTWGQVSESSIRTSATNTIDGGKQLLAENTALMSHQPITGQEAYIALGKWPYNGGATGGYIYAQGKFPNRYTANSNAGIWLSHDSVGAGFGGANYLYGPTMNEYMNVVVTISGVAGESCVTDNMVATGFGVKWNGTNAHLIHIWATRMEM